MNERVLKNSKGLLLLQIYPFWKVPEMFEHQGSLQDMKYKTVKLQKKQALLNPPIKNNLT